MPIVVFVEADGTQREVELNTGQSLMSAAVNEGVRGIDAECGGGMACATCHVHLEGEWAQRAGLAEGPEADLLAFVDGFEADRSRLSCQLVMRDDLDGMVLRIPQ